MLYSFMRGSERQIINAFLFSLFSPTVSMAVLIWLFQLFLAHFVFRDREFPKITITVDNRYFQTFPPLAKQTHTQNFFNCRFLIISSITLWFFFWFCLADGFSPSCRTSFSSTIFCLDCSRVLRESWKECSWVLCSCLALTEPL